MSTVAVADDGSHACLDHAFRAVREGDDVVVELCVLCGRIRHETDGVRPFAWYVDSANPTGYRYAYDDPRNEPGKPDVWRYPDVLIESAYVLEIARPR